MSEANNTALKQITINNQNFSLVLGGPLFQLLRRSKLTDDHMQLLMRRLTLLPLLAWLPLLALSVLGGYFHSGTAVPFLYDVEVHIRFLIAMPLLIGAEFYVHERLRFILSNFLDRKIIPEQYLEKYNNAIASAIKMRNSISAEILLIVLVYAVGILVVWKNYTGLHGDAWYATFQNGQRTLNLAGYWLVLFSLPFFQFLLIRWYYRLFIWARMLWQISRIPLRIIPTHPDRFGGLGFLTESVYSFTLLAAAHGSLFSAFIANRILYTGASLPVFKYEIVMLLVFLFLLFVAPLFLFSNQLAAAKRAGKREYGGLAQRYVQEYDNKWLRAGAPIGEPFMGSADIQSLADLNNGYEVVNSMRFLPIGKDASFLLLAWTLLPLAPLILTMMPLNELMKKLVEIIL